MNVVPLKALGHSVYRTHLRAETLRKYEKNIYRSNYNEKNEWIYNQRKFQGQNIEIRKFLYLSYLCGDSSWIIFGFKRRQTTIICVLRYVNRPL